MTFVWDPTKRKPHNISNTCCGSISKLNLRLYTLKAEVDKVRLPGKVNQFTCKVRLTGRIASKEIGFGPIILTFEGLGQFVPGFTNLATAPALDCPLSSLAPAGLAPIAGQCATPNCLISKFGYQWWTSYNYFAPPFPQQQLNNQWSPMNTTDDAEGLHLFIQPQDTGRGPKPSAAEIVAMFNADGFPVPMGDGDYLVTATIKMALSWDKLDPNVAFGAFTYEHLGTDGTGSGGQNNPFRELDLAEISHWGYAGPLLPPSHQPISSRPASLLSATN